MSVRQPDVEEAPTERIDELPSAGQDGAGNVKHGYPPPRLSVGSITTAYCGEPMVVEGAVSDQPPRDACPVCALEWRSRHKWVPWL